MALDGHPRREQGQARHYTLVAHERRPVGPGQPAASTPGHPGQVGPARRPRQQRGDAATPAVEVRSTSSRAYGVRAGRRERRHLVVGQTALGADDHHQGAVVGNLHRGQRRGRPPRGARRPRRLTRRAPHLARSWPAARPRGTTPGAPASRPRGPWPATGPATSRPVRPARRPPTGAAAHGTIVATPISVSTSTASSPRSPLGSACTTVTDGLGRGHVPTTLGDLDRQARFPVAARRPVTDRAARRRSAPRPRRRGAGVRRPRGAPRRPRPRPVARARRRPATRPSGPAATSARLSASLNASRIRPNTDLLAARREPAVGLLLAADRGQLAQQLLLAGVEPGRGLDHDRHDQVAAAAAQPGHAAAAERVLAAGLGAGLHLELERRSRRRVARPTRRRPRAWAGSASCRAQPRSSARVTVQCRSCRRG